MKILKNVSLLLVLAMGIIGFSSFIDSDSERSPAKWHKLGMRTVNMKADHDVIMVTAAEGFFTKLKFKVMKAPLFVKNVRVVFGNGADRNIDFNKRFTAGTETRVIDLPGNKRVIKKIILNYKTPKTGHGHGKAIVSVWGRR